MVLEIVIDALTSDAACRVDARGAPRADGGRCEHGLVAVTAGNYGGNLGRHHYHLRDLLTKPGASHERPHLREAPPERLDFLNITPLALSGLSEAEAASSRSAPRGRGLRLGDCFSVKLDRSDSLVIEGGSERLDRVGAALSEGTIRVAGDVGQRLGEGMAGGALTVEGAAGPYAGAGATGGLITITAMPTTTRAARSTPPRRGSTARR